MFNKKDLGLDFLNNPNKIQKSVIEDMQSRLDGGKRIIADANNSFNYLLESFAFTTSEAVCQVENTFDGFYKRRAQTTEDLYKHMSDFDYLGLFGTPATLDIDLFLDKKHLIDHAYDYNANYKKAVIPKDATFKLGKYDFGIYYPIEIQINKFTDSIMAVYDTTKSSPLNKLTNNTVTKKEIEFNGREYLRLSFTIYQFNKFEIEKDLISATGFCEKLPYKDKFYAVRAFNKIDGEYKEFKYALSDTVYDPSTPTMKIVNITETKEVKLSIPQVYLSNKQIGKKIKLEIYTTKGELDVNISELAGNDISANFTYTEEGTSKYTTVFKNIPTLEIYPQSKKIVGGSNGYTYNQLRTYVVNDTLHENVPITPVDIKHYFQKKGYLAEKQYDGITQRVYYGYKPLTDHEGSLIPVTNTLFKINKEVVDSTETIKQYLDNTITILPTTLFEYNITSGECKPLADAIRQKLENSQPRELVEILNENVYTKSIHHIRLIPDARFPIAESFDLTNVEAYDLSFVKDNISMYSQVTAAQSYLGDSKSGSDGYIFRLGMTMSKDLVDVDMDKILVYVTLSTVTGSVVGRRMKHIGKSGDLEVFELHIKTDYNINDLGELNITNLKGSNGAMVDHFIDLDSEFTIVTGIDKSLIADVVNQDNEIIRSVPSKYADTYIGSSKQTVNLKFGSKLKEINNNVDATWSAIEYELYKRNVYETYSEDVYEKNPDGTIKVEIIDNNGKKEVKLNKIHSAGEVKKDAAGISLIKYKKGTIKHDQYGNPQVSKNREQVYYIDLIQFGLNMFYDNATDMQKYVKDLPGFIEGYLDDIKNMGKNMHNLTYLYFKPIRTLGLGRFGLGDNKSARLSLDLSFKMKFFVPSFVKSDPKILNMIRTKTINIIEEKLTHPTISMTDMSKTIKKQFGSFIESIDVGGINGDIKLQTLIVDEIGVRPNIKRKLVYENANIKLVKDVEIEFIEMINK